MRPGGASLGYVRMYDMNFRLRNKRKAQVKFKGHREKKHPPSLRSLVDDTLEA